MTNLYHVLHHYPALESYEMPKETEALAQQLAASGLLRIDALEKRNFVRFSIPESGINLAFSIKQLTDKCLIPRSQKIITQCLTHIGYKNPSKHLPKEWNRLLANMEKIIPVYPEWEIKLARLLVQSSHPIITHLILLEQIEVFVGFGFEIGDVMDIHNWRTSGKNSGMQSTGGMSDAIYVSCGGNPFTTDKKYATHTTDGFAAMARTLIIAGQEMGHFADIIRDKRGNKISRHSADLNGAKAKEPVRKARLSDIYHSRLTHRKLVRLGLERLARYDADQYHYHKFKIKGLRPTWLKLLRFIFKFYLLRNCKKAGLNFVFDLQKEPYFGKQLVLLFHDMQFNLTPKADVYSRENPQEEEAIACIEALARVPQQVNKWGHAATKVYMKGLYYIYYNQVIPSCIQTYQQITGHTYHSKLTPGKKPLWLKLKHLVRKPTKPAKTDLMSES